MLLAVAGLLYVKWLPYYHKAILTAGAHSLGPSIITGGGVAPPQPSWTAALSYATIYGESVWKALVLGVLLGSAVQTLLPRDWISRALGENGFVSIVAAAALATPGMMCTCCAAPIVVGLRQSRATVGAAIAFWLGGSLLNPATLIFMGFVLGWRWAAFRFVIAMLVVLGFGWFADRMVSPNEGAVAQAALGKIAASPRANLFVRWLKQAARLGLGLIPEYIVLALALGAARGWLFPHVTPDVGDHLSWIVGMAVAGALFVIPTAGEVPIVQTMRSLGMGAGPAAALLMTLPPISLPSLFMVAGAIRPRILALLTLSIMGVGVASGLLAAALHL
jgi:hypothetical protein